MVSVVQDVHQVRIEGVNIIQLGKAVNNTSELLINGLLHELDFSHVELANALNLESLAHFGGGLALRL